jgi:hypothetical protein
MKTAGFSQSITGIGAVAVNSNPFNVGAQTTVFMMAKVTGTGLTGTVKLQVSADGVEWADLVSGSQSMGATGGNLYWNIEHFGGLAVRAQAVASAGTAAVVLTGYAKG